MSASARKRANRQAQEYPTAVLEALASEAPPYDDGRIFRAITCPDCGQLRFPCPHDRARLPRYRLGA